MFEQMTAEIRSETVQRLYGALVRAVTTQQEQFRQRQQRMREYQQKQRELTTNQGEGATTEKKKPRTVDKKPGPNDPCPCGSGKKYKKCCGRLPD